MSDAKETPVVRISDLNAMRIFKIVADSGGLSAAQAKLGMSLSHISSTLTDFEERFGVKLCHRGRAGFSLTGEGQQIYASAGRLIQALEVFESDLASFRGVLAGTLCIAGHGGDFTHEDYILPDVINRFLSRENNHANIRLEMGSQEFIANGVVNGSIDAGIGYFPSAVAGVMKYSLYEETAFLYCAKGHALFEPKPSDISMAEIRSFEFAMRSEHAMPLDTLNGVSVRAIAPTQEARALLILSGKFLAFLPDHVAARWVAKGVMRQVGGPELSYRTVMEIITRDSKQSSALVRSFLEDYAAVSIEKQIKAPLPAP